MAESHRKVEKEQTYESVTEEIRILRDRIKRAQQGDISAMGPYTYPVALKRIQYLRNRQIQLKKK